MFHHDTVPEFLVSAALRAIAVLHALQLTEPGAVKLRLPQDVLDEQGVIDREQAAGADLFKNALLEGDQALHLPKGVPVQAAHLRGQSGGNAQLRPAVTAGEAHGPGGQLPVDGDAGQALGLALGPVGKAGKCLAAVQHTAADNMVAQRDGPGQDRLKAAQKQLALSGESRPRRRKARFQKQGVFFHVAGKEQVQL